MKKVLLGLFAVMSISAFAHPSKPSQPTWGPPQVDVEKVEENKTQAQIKVSATIEEPIRVESVNNINFKKIVRGKYSDVHDLTSEIIISGPENKDIYVYHAGDDVTTDTITKEFGNGDKFTHKLFAKKDFLGQLFGTTKNKTGAQGQAIHYMKSSLTVAATGAGGANYTDNVTITVATKY